MIVKLLREMSEHRRPSKTNLLLREKFLLSFKSEHYNACSKAPQPALPSQGGGKRTPIDNFFLYQVRQIVNPTFGV